MDPVSKKPLVVPDIHGHLIADQKGLVILKGEVQSGVMSHGYGRRLAAPEQRCSFASGPLKDLCS